MGINDSDAYGKDNYPVLCDIVDGFYMPREWSIRARSAAVAAGAQLAIETDLPFDGLQRLVEELTKYIIEGVWNDDQV